MLALALVIAAISPGELNQVRDYVERIEYAARSILEYWLIGPESQTITVLKLVNEQYGEHGVFQRDDRLTSPTFGLLQLTAS